MRLREEKTRECGFKSWIWPIWISLTNQLMESFPFIRLYTLRNGSSLCCFASLTGFLRGGGRICVAVKEGDTEGYVEELIGFKTKLYFANFNEDEIRNYLEANKFRVVSLETRHPYDFEIPVDRIYATGVKVARAL